MGHSDHGTTYMRVGGDDGGLRPWHYIYEGRRGRWGTPTMALHIRIAPGQGGSSTWATGGKGGFGGALGAFARPKAHCPGQWAFRRQGGGSTWDT